MLCVNGYRRAALHRFVTLEHYLDSSYESHHEIDSAYATNKIENNDHLNEVSYNEGYLAGSSDTIKRALAYFDEVAEIVRRYQKDDSLISIANRLGEIDRKVCRQIFSIGRELDEILTEALKILYRDQFIERSIAELASAINRSLMRFDDIVIRVNGPPDLNEKLKKRLGRRSSFVEMVDSDSIDLSIEINKMRISTKIREWTEKIDHKMTSRNESFDVHQ